VVARPTDNTAIPPEIYNREYLLSANLEGYQEYLQGTLSAIKQKQLQMLSLTADSELLEIGFGRGEFLRHCAARCRHATGIYYSPAACEIARQTLQGVPNAEVQVADCRALPFAAASFDRVYAGDVIEHLSFADGTTMLREAWRVLRPGGYLLVHTAPNAVFIRYVYPLARLLLRLVNPESIRNLDRHLEIGAHVHVFEFSLPSLRRIARDAGLADARAWIDADLLRSGHISHTGELLANPLVRLVGTLGRFSSIRFFLGNDLYLRCAKPTVSAAA
jgi:ubiquinone/menaquinone biosynthesis C-methylase UbiE